MKSTLICLFLLVFSLVKAQDLQKYDARLLKNHGDTILTIYARNHNYYNFLLYELDHSFEIKSKADLNSSNWIPASQFTNAGGSSLKVSDIQSGIFNFKEWGIVLKQHEPVIIELDEDQILYFYDKVSNNIRFGKSSFNTK